MHSHQVHAVTQQLLLFLSSHFQVHNEKTNPVDLGKCFVLLLKCSQGTNEQLFVSQHIFDFKQMSFLASVEHFTASLSSLWCPQC